MSDIPSIWPCLTCTDPRAMVTFLTTAFGLSERVVHGEGDVVHHAELTWTGPTGRIGGVMLGPAEPGCGRPPGSSATHVVVDDPDARFATATAAGATVVRALEDTDYGSRQFVVTDPEGNLWSFGTWYE